MASALRLRSTRSQQPLGISTFTRNPQLSVVIVNYRQWENTAGLVKQLRSSHAIRTRKSEILIVDNHSPRHPLVPKLRRCPGLSLRRWGRNRGFARAVNEGSRLSQGEWLLLLNPDMTLPPNFLDQVLEYTQRLKREHPEVGIVGLGLRNSDGTVQHSAGFFPTLARTLRGLLVSRSRRKYRQLSKDRPSEVDWVTGCCMLLRRDCLDQLDGLDPDFFLYYEDVDLCRRAKSLGWSVLFNPNIFAFHHHPLHQRQVPATLRVVTRHSLLTYGKKHWPSWHFQLLAGIVGWEAWLRKTIAAGQGNDQRAYLFAELSLLTKEMASGKTKAANKRIRMLTRSCDLYQNPPTNLPVSQSGQDQLLPSPSVLFAGQTH